MRFSSGMLAALVVTLALMGTIAMGFLSSVEKVNTTAIEYDYLTDATSLFSYSTDPEYSDYSPNVNYTHYSTSFDMANTGSGATFYTSGINYTATAGNLVNQYRVYEEATTVTQTVTLTSSMSSISGSGNSNNSTLHIAREIWDGSRYVVMYEWERTGAYAVTLSTALNSISISSTSNIHYIDLRGSGVPWVIWGDNIRWESTNMGHYYKTILRSNAIVCNYGTTPYAAYAIYNDLSNEVTLYRADGYIYYTGSPSNVALVFGGTLTQSGILGYDAGNTLTIETTGTQPATYMDISQGVSFTEDTVYWGNGYDLGKLSLIIEAPSSATSLYITGKNASGTTVGGITVDYTSSGFSIGAWDAVLLTMDFTNGTYTIAGVTNLISMTDYQVSNYSASGTFTATGMPHVIEFAVEDDSEVGLWTLNVASTTVYTTASSGVMQNPTIDLDAYFLNEDYLRLNLYSFAYYGNSITINGHTYTVNDGKITVYADGRNRSYELSNVLINWEDGECYLTFKNSNVTVDLGEYTSKGMSLGGNWYFTASVYEGELVNSYHWNYNLGEWDLSQSAFILIFLGVLGVGAAVIHVKRGLTALDIVALILVALTAYLLLG